MDFWLVPPGDREWIEFRKHVWRKDFAKADVVKVKKDDLIKVKRKSIFGGEEQEKGGRKKKRREEGRKEGRRREEGERKAV